MYSLVSGALPRGLRAPSPLYSTATQYKKPGGKSYYPIPKTQPAGPVVKIVPRGIAGQDQ